jgi:hypothetical protein
MEGEIYTKLFQYDQSLLQYDGNVIYRDIFHGVKHSNFHGWHVAERSYNMKIKKYQCQNIFKILSNNRRKRGKIDPLNTYIHGR